MGPSEAEEEDKEDSSIVCNRAEGFGHHTAVHKGRMMGHRGKDR